MGSIGAPSHMNFGMVGDAVNTAHHLVELAQHGQIILSGAVIESMDDEPEGWTFEPLPHVEIRHKSTPLQVYLARLDQPAPS
jgi:class 3 adenylate cyclase